MTEEKTIEPVDPTRVQIIAQEALVVAHAPGIEQPVHPATAKVRGCSRTCVQHRQLRERTRRPMGPLNINVTGREPGEDVHQTENDFRQAPVRVVENHR